MEKKLILIVDDEDQICSELGGYLAQKGYKTITANNGADGYDLFISEKPVCVLTDYRMPVMDGLELLKKIKSINKYVHVILISAVADMKAVVEAMKNEAFDFLSKPVDLRDLLTLVDIAVQKTMDSIKKQNDGHMTSILYHSLAENNNDVSILYFNKDMDERTIDKFRQYINGLLVEQSFRSIVIFQLENTKYINNIGLNFLIEMQELFLKSGKKLFLCSVGAQVSAYLRTLGYDSFFYIGTDTTAILEHIRLNKL